jgi:signal transduction histidine kinase
MTAVATSIENRVLVCAARRGDEELTTLVLRKAGFAAEASQDIADLCEQISTGAGAVVAGEERLSLGGVESLLQVLQRQPSWSELPFVVLTSGGRSTVDTRLRSQMLERLGQITLLERPVRTVTLLASIKAALASRARQYEVRNQLSELVRQREELTRSNEALEQFAYAAAHDLQEPIRNVSLYTQLLSRWLDGHIEGDTKRHFDIIVEGAGRMQNLVEDLLEYTRAVNSPGHQSCMADARAVFGEVLDSLRGLIEETQAVVTHGQLPFVAVHAPHLLQLLQNVISNGIKYRSEKAPRVHVAAECDAISWRFSVQDNGIGIAPEFQEKIFGVFKRLHGRETPGNGIGLAICQRIVNHYGGKIWVNSTPGCGSEFCFTLPTLKANDARRTYPNSNC